MKAFLRVVIGALLAQLILIGAIILVIVSLADRKPEIKDGSVLVQVLEGSIPDAPPVSGMPFSTTMSHADILDNMEKAIVDDHIAAVVVKSRGGGLGMARQDEFRSAVVALRAAGKPVWLYTEFLDRGSLYLGAACDSLFLLPNGYASIHGMAAERPFFGRTFEKLGIEPNIDKIGQYKSAAELVQRESISDPARRNIEWILDSRYPAWLRVVAEGRGLTMSFLEDSVLAMPAINPDEALALGLVDRLVYWDEVEERLLALEGVKTAKKEKDSVRSRPRTISCGDYGKLSRADVGIKGKKKIAVVYAQGMIGGEESGNNFPLGETMGAATMERAFRQAAENEDVAAIVYRVASGGGESSTSWRIQRAAALAAQTKPVVVSFGDMAASGGYLIAYPFSPILAGPQSIVGSIGSISGKMNMRGLYEKMGMTKDHVTRGPNALMESDYFDYTPDQFEAFRERHMADYQFWVADIALHRGMTQAEVDSLGRGRVFTGEQALARGLIDSLGGYWDAVRVAKEKAGIPADEDVEIVRLPEKAGPLEALKRGGLAMALRAIVDQVLGPPDRGQTWAVDWTRYD